MVFVCVPNCSVWCGGSWQWQLAWWPISGFFCSRYLHNQTYFLWFLFHIHTPPHTHSHGSLNLLCKSNSFHLSTNVILNIFYCTNNSIGWIAQMEAQFIYPIRQPWVQIPAWVLWQFEKDAHGTYYWILVVGCDSIDMWTLRSWKHYVDQGRTCQKTLNQIKN